MKIVRDASTIKAIALALPRVVNYAHRVMHKIVAPLTNDSRGVI